MSTCNASTYIIIKQYYGVCNLCKSSIPLYAVSERKRQVVIRQIRFVSNAFLCSEFKLKNISPLQKIFTGKMFAEVFICGNFFFVDGWKNRNKTEKLQRAKISCHIHGSLLQGPYSYLCKTTCVK